MSEPTSIKNLRDLVSPTTLGTFHVEPAAVLSAYDDMEKRAEAAEAERIKAQHLLDSADCSAREGLGLLHCRHDAKCTVCSLRAEVEALRKRLHEWVQWGDRMASGHPDAPMASLDHEVRAVIANRYGMSVITAASPALALAQPRADAGGYGKAWATMLRERTAASARDAYAAAAAAYADTYAAYAAESAAAYTSEYASESASEYAAYAAESAAAYTSEYASEYASESASEYAAYAAAWDTMDPVGLLRRLVAVTDERALAVQPTTEGM